MLERLSLCFLFFSLVFFVDGADLALKGRPRLFCTKAEAAKLKDAPIKASPELLTQKTMKIYYLSGKALVYQLPPRESREKDPPPGFKGVYPYWTAMGKRVLGKIQGLTLSYYKTGDKRYADMIIKYLEALSEWSSWNEHDHNSLSLCHLTIGFATGFDAVYDLLDDAQKERLASALVRLGLKPIYKEGLRKKDHNIVALQYAALGVGALALLGEKSAPDAEAYIQLAKKYFNWYLDVRENSMDNEGIGYTTFVMDNLLMFADALQRISGDSSLLNSKYVKKEYPLWLIYSLAPDGDSCIPLADYSGSPLGGTAMKILEKNFDDKTVAWYLKKSGLVSGVRFSDIIYASRNKECKADLLAGLPCSAHLKKQGLASMRSSWAPEALFCALSSSGSTCDHTHFDQNSFVLNINGEWIFNDPGYRNIKGGWNAPEFSGWRYTVMSYGHNTLLVDGKGQDKRGHGRIVDFFHSPWIDYAAGDATLAYPDGVLKKFVRNILCVHPKFLIIWDEIESPQPARFELLFHPGSHSAVNCDGKTLSLKTIRRNNIKLHSLLPEDSIMTMSSFPGLKKDKASYAELSTKERKLSVDFLSFIVAEHGAGYKNSLQINPLPEMIFDSSGLEMRKIHALGKRALLLKAAGPNDFASFEVDIKEPGEYEFSSVLFASPLYGAVSALVDGKIIAGPIDRYAKSAEVKEFVHGNIRLTKGKHIIKYVCNGKNSASSGCYMGIASILLRKKQEASDKVSKTEAPALPVKGENFCGLEIKDSDLDYKFIFNTTDAENIQTDKGLAFSGRIGGVALDDKNKIKRYFLLNGKTLKYNERILAKSELPCKISFMEDDGSMEALVETTIEGRNKVSLWMPGGKSVTVNGKSVDLNDSYKKGVFEIPCEKGKFVIKAKLGE